MLWSIAFSQIGVVMSDLYFLDPNGPADPDGAERGVRLELRHFERASPKGSVYAAIPISIGSPIWRVDLLETVTSEPGSLNRAHHHPRLHNWEPGARKFVEALSNDPLRWVHDRFDDIETVLVEAGYIIDDLDPGDIEGLRRSGTMIETMLKHLLTEVHEGRAGLAPETSGVGARVSWL